MLMSRQMMTDSNSLPNQSDGLESHITQAIKKVFALSPLFSFFFFFCEIMAFASHFLMF